MRPPAMTARRPGRRAAERLAWLDGAAPARTHRRGHARPRAGLRARRPAARAGRRGGRGPRDPRSCRSRPRCRDLARYDLRLPDEPQRRARCCSSGWPRRPRCPRARRRDRRRDRPGYRARPARARRSIADVVPERFVAEGLVEALAAIAVQPRADRPRRGRPRRPARRPARARRRGRRARALRTVAEPLDEPTRAAARGADYVTFTSSSTVRFFLEAAGGPRRSSARADRLDRPGDERDAARAGLEPHVEAEQHDVDGLRRRARCRRRRALIERR